MIFEMKIFLHIVCNLIRWLLIAEAVDLRSVGRDPRFICLQNYSFNKYQTCARHTDPRGVHGGGGISKIFRRGGIEGVYFLMTKCGKNQKKPEKPVFFCLNLTKLTLI